MQTHQRAQQAFPQNSNTSSNQNLVLHLDRTLFNDYQSGLNDPQYKHMLLAAIVMKSKESLQYILRKHYIETYYLITLLIRHGQADYFEQLLYLINTNKIPFDIDGYPENTESLLRTAYAYLMQEPNNKNRLKILKLILQNNAAIVEDVWRNNIDAVRLYIQNGAQLQALSNQLLLHLSTSNNNIKMTELLLQNGYPINQLDECGNTSLYKSVAWANLDLIKLLLQYHVPLYAPNSPQENLVKAVENNNLNDVITALQSKIPGDAINEKGEHVLAIAARHKNAKIIHVLMHYGHANARYLVRLGDKASITYILESVPCHFSDTERKALIHIAYKYKQQAILKILQEFDQRMSDNHTAPAPSLDDLSLISASSSQAIEPYGSDDQQGSESGQSKSSSGSETMVGETLIDGETLEDDSMTNFRLPETFQNTRTLTTNAEKTLWRHAPEIIIMHEILLTLFLPITYQASWDGLRENILAFLRKKQQFNSKYACIRTLIYTLEKYLIQLKLDQSQYNNSVRNLPTQLEEIFNRPEIEKLLIQLGLLPQQATKATTSQPSMASSASSSSVTSSAAPAVSEASQKVRLNINLHTQVHIGLRNPQSYSELSSSSTSSIKAAPVS